MGATLATVILIALFVLLISVGPFVAGIYITIKKRRGSR